MGLLRVGIADVMCIIPALHRQQCLGKYSFRRIRRTLHSSALILLPMNCIGADPSLTTSNHRLHSSIRLARSARYRSYEASLIPVGVILV
jgi:hypothetical protein